MSRSYCTYDEDWQRRKSLLIRSLFHDIPILSPVEEESNGSSQEHYIPNQEAFPSPERPYSPLPPLIIERIPITNKHDEPEEYYRKLHKKIKRIYKKLFIENRNISSMDLDSNYNDSSINDDGEGSVDNLVINTENKSPDNSNSDIEEREERPSSASTKSNGYGADFESMDTAIIDVVNRTASNEDVVMISEDEGTGSGNLHVDRTIYDNDRNSKSGNDEYTKYRIDDDKEPPFSITDNQNTTETEESIDAEIEQRSETETSVKEVMDEHEMIETIQSNTVNLVDADVSRGVESVLESHHSIIDDQEMTESDKSNEEEKEQAEADQHSDVSESKSEAFEMISSGEENNLIVQNDEPMEEDVETSQSSGGPYFKQITTEAVIHFDGYDDSGDRESRIYEDSVKSVILPTRFRRVIANCNIEEDRIEVLAELEENTDPRTTSTFDTEDNETTENDLEEVTTPHLEGNVEHDEPEDIEDDEDEEMNASLTDSIDRDKEEPNVTGKTEERGDLESDDTDVENEEMVDEPNDLGEMRLRLDTIEEDDEDISSHHTEENFEVDVEETTTPRVKEISVHKPTAEGEAEVETHLRIDTPEEEFQEISPALLDSTKEHVLETEFAEPNTTDDDKRTPTPVTNEDVMRSTPPEVTTEETEPMLTPQQNATKEQVRNKEPESTVKEMKTPTAATDDVEELESPHSIELMRTPRHDLSHETIPEPVTHDSESTGEHTALPQELTTLTFSTQDGGDNNMSELQTSNDMNEILTSIFNESQNKDGNTIFRRKRKLVDKSVQAVKENRVSWDEMRGNFFIGTPKIFRLCACTDHVCP